MEAIAHDPMHAAGERKLANVELPEARNAAGTAWTQRANGGREPVPPRSAPASRIRRRPSSPQVDGAASDSLPNDPKVAENDRHRLPQRDRRLAQAGMDARHARHDRRAIRTRVAQTQGEVDAARAPGRRGDRLPGLETHLEQRSGPRCGRRSSGSSTMWPARCRRSSARWRSARVPPDPGARRQRRGVQGDRRPGGLQQAVQPGVDAVRNAYRTGGAKAAAETLRQQTENGVAGDGGAHRRGQPADDRQCRGRHEAQPDGRRPDRVPGRRRRLRQCRHRDGLCRARQRRSPGHRRRGADACCGICRARNSSRISRTVRPIRCRPTRRR